MIILLALDLATVNTGYAVFNEDRLVESGVLKVKGDLEDRLILMKRQIIKVCEKHRVTAIISEQEQIHKAGATTNALCKQSGVLRCTSDDMNIPYVFVPINTWRIDCGIKHNMKRDLQKAEAIKKVKELYDVNTKSDDEAEAILIGRYAIKNKLFVDRV